MTTGLTGRRYARRLGAGMAALASMASLAMLPSGTASAAPSGGNAPPPANCKTTNGAPVAKDGSNLAAGCFSLNVSPARIVIRPSATVKDMTQTFQVYNNGNIDYDLQVFAIEFTQDPSGGLTQVKDNQESAVKVSIDHPSIAMKGFYDIKPGPTGAVSVAPVTVRISPQANAGPGDHQIAIIFRKPADPRAGNIKVAPQIGTQVLLQLPGKVTSGVNLINPKFDSKSKIFGFMQPGTTDLTVGVQNTGNVHHDFYSAKDISATINGFGSTKNTTLTFPQFTVLRDSIRNADSTWDSSGKFTSSKPPLYCWCTATITANVTYPARVTSTASDPHVVWKPLLGATEYTIYRDGRQLASVPYQSNSWTDPKPDGTAGAVTYTVVGTLATTSKTVPYHVIPVVLIIVIVVSLLLLIGLTVFLLKRRKNSKRKAAEVAAALAERDAELETLRAAAGTGTHSSDGATPAMKKSDPAE